MAERDPPPTQENGSSQVQYAWVILFNYNINNPSPFSMVPLNFFAGSDFPWKTIRGFLSSHIRKQTRSFSNLPGKKFNIFAKVEIGKISFVFLPLILLINYKKYVF